jgi:hypothetical protein
MAVKPYHPEAHDPHPGAVVAILLDDPIEGSGHPVAALPAINGGYQPLDDAHGPAPMPMVVSPPASCP